MAYPYSDVQLNNSHISPSLTREKKLPPLPSFSEPLMPPKSLTRKNIKQLSFNPTPLVKEEMYYSGEVCRLTVLKNEPKKKSHSRPAPLFSLEKPSQTAQHELLGSLRSLEISGQPDDNSEQLCTTQRKRRTVISSISPTKSPLEAQQSHNSANHLTLKLNNPEITSLPVTPLESTSAVFKLRDDDLLHLKDLGSGNSGVVSKVLHIPSQKTMARKVILVDSNLAVQTQIIRELRIMHECRSPYIIKFHGAFLRANNSIVLCMEYCNCGSLDRIQKLCPAKKFPLLVLKRLSHSILSGLSYLYHTHRIIHRDIKPSNVLMSHRGEFKLCDFGVSRELTNSVAMADTFVGTSTYMSPERIQGLNYGIKSDVWSMGLMLIELASGKAMWSEEDGDGDSECMASGPEGILDLLQRIVNEKSPTLTNKFDMNQRQPYDADLCSFIDLCLVKNENLRSGPEELLGDKFLAKVPFSVYDKKVKIWAKEIRKLHKEMYEKE